MKEHTKDLDFSLFLISHWPFPDPFEYLFNFEEKYPFNFGEQWNQRHDHGISVG